MSSDRAVTRTASLALLLMLWGCDRGLDPATALQGLGVPRIPRPQPQPPAVATAPTVTRRPLDPAVVGWVHGAAVGNDDYARRVLYSWTSDATVARMRADEALFDDNQLPQGPTAYVQRLQHTASRDDVSGRLAKLVLGHPDLRQRRYAWVRPWATRLGIQGPYGDHLIEVVLRPNAIVGRYNPSRRVPWEFRDLDGRRVPLGRVLANPHRIAAILHVRDDAQPRFREYVLCNESAVQSWSLATDRIATVIAADARALHSLAGLRSATLPGPFIETLAFDVPHYEPTRGNLHAIANSLSRAKPMGEPLTVRPRRRFRHHALPEVVQTREIPARFIMVA